MVISGCNLTSLPGFDPWNLSTSLDEQLPVDIGVDEGLDVFSTNCTRGTPLQNATFYPTPYNMYTVIMGGFASGSSCVIGLICNPLSILVFSRERGDSAAPFLLSMVAVYDLMFNVLGLVAYCSPSFHPYSGWLEWFWVVFQQYIVYLWPLVATARVSSTYMLTFVALDRYMAICKPTETAELRTVAKWRTRVIAMLSFCFLYNVPKFFDTEYVGYVPCEPGSKDFCFTVKAKDWGVYKVIYRFALHMVFSYAIPLSAMVTLNVKIVLAVRKADKMRCRVSNAMKGNQREVTGIVIALLTLFFLAVLPHVLLQFLIVFLDRLPPEFTEMARWVWPIVYFLTGFNACVNFFVYGLLGSKFRRGLRALFRCGKDVARDSLAETSDTSKRNSRSSRESQISSRQSELGSRDGSWNSRLHSGSGPSRIGSAISVVSSSLASGLDLADNEPRLMRISSVTTQQTAL